MAGLVGTIAVLLVLLAGGGIASAYYNNESRKDALTQKQAAEQQKLVAESRLALVRKALATFVSDVPEALKNAPFAGAVQDSVNHSIIGLLNDAQDTTDDAGMVRRGRIGMLRREGDLLLRRNDLKGAEKKYQAAQQVAEDALKSEATQKDTAAGNLAVVLTALAELAAQQRQADQAINYMEKAIVLRKRIVEAPQTGEIPPAEAKASLGGAYSALALILRERKADYTAALDNAHRAEKLLREALASGSTTPKLQEQHKMQQGLASLEAGRAALKLGQIVEGKRGFEEAVRHFQELTKDFPGKLIHLQHLDIAAAEYGDELLIRLHQPAEARRFYEIAVAQSRGLALSPAIRNYQQIALAKDRYRLATAALKAGDKKSAEMHYLACRALRESLLRDLEASPEAEKDRSILTPPLANLMFAQARCGQHDEAASVALRLLNGASRLQDAHPRKKSLLFASACAFALSAETPDTEKRQEYFTKALQALRLLVDSGCGSALLAETRPHWPGQQHQGTTPASIPVAAGGFADLGTR